MKNIKITIGEGTARKIIHLPETWAKDIRPNIAEEDQEAFLKKLLLVATQKQLFNTPFVEGYKINKVIGRNNNFSFAVININDLAAKPKDLMLRKGDLDKIKLDQEKISYEKVNLEVAEILTPKQEAPKQTVSASEKTAAKMDAIRQAMKDLAEKLKQQEAMSPPKKTEPPKPLAIASKAPPVKKTNNAFVIMKKAGIYTQAIDTAMQEYKELITEVRAREKTLKKFDVYLPTKKWDLTPLKAALNHALQEELKKIDGLTRVAVNIVNKKITENMSLAEAQKLFKLTIEHYNENHSNKIGSSQGKILLDEMRGYDLPRTKEVKASISFQSNKRFSELYHLNRKKLLIEAELNKIVEDLKRKANKDSGSRLMRADKQVKEIFSEIHTQLDRMEVEIQKKTANSPYVRKADQVLEMAKNLKKQVHNLKPIASDEDRKHAIRKLEYKIDTEIKKILLDKNQIAIASKEEAQDILLRLTEVRADNLSQYDEEAAQLAAEEYLNNMLVKVVLDEIPMWGKQVSGWRGPVVSYTDPATNKSIDVTVADGLGEIVEVMRSTMPVREKSDQLNRIGKERLNIKGYLTDEPLARTKAMNEFYKCCAKMDVRDSNHTLHSAHLLEDFHLKYQTGGKTAEMNRTKAQNEGGSLKIKRN